MAVRNRDDVDWIPTAYVIDLAAGGTGGINPCDVCQTHEERDPDSVAEDVVAPGPASEEITMATGGSPTSNSVALASWSLRLRPYRRPLTNERPVRTSWSTRSGTPRAGRHA